MNRVLTLLFLLICGSGFSQILKNTNLNLNAGGVIHDVVYDSYYDAYIVVGDFTSINGQPRNNLAFIDANTYAVMAYNPISSIDGEIRTVEFYSSIPLFSTFPPDPQNPDGLRYYLFLGGNFGTINGDSVEFLARMSASHVYGMQPVGTKAPYIVNSTWSIDGIYAGYNTGLGVYDLHLDADTLVVAGEFYSQKPYYPMGQRNFLNAYDVTTNANNGWLNWFPDNGQIYNTSQVYSIEKFEGEYYFTCADEVFRYTPQGVNTTPFYDYLQTTGSTVPHARQVGFGVSSSGDAAMLTTYDAHANGYYVEMDSTNQVNTPSPHVSYWKAVDFETYKDYIYSCESASTASALTTRKLNSGYALTTESTISLNSNWQPVLMSTFTPERQAEGLFRLNNRLFLSGSNLTTVNGTGRTGLAIFCLEPRNAEPFTSFDNTACEEESAIYTIPQAEYAEGYRWSYSGAGAMYRITGSGSPWAPLVSENVSATNANSIEVYFPVGTTGGTLTVEPYSTCNTTTDYQYSEGQSDVISINAKPDIILDPIHTLNCYSDSTILVAQTTNPNPQFEWSFNGGTLANDSLLITINDTVLLDSVYYVMEITDAVTGCVNSDSTFFYQDLVATPIDASLTTTNPLVWTCSTTSMTINSNQTNYIVEWVNPANGATYPDPFTITSAPNGVVYDLHGIQISNGCATQDQFGSFTINEESADPVFVGHPTFLTDLIDDSLNCASPSLSIQCDVDPAYSGVASAEWYYQGSSLGTDILNLTTVDSTGMDANGLKYYTIVTTHSTSSCQDSVQVIIKFDYNKPLIATMSDQTINCSQSEVLLTHPINGSSNVVEGWLDEFGTQTNATTITATTTGEYIYSVQSNLNGCSNYDTVSVVQTLDLWLDMPQDTLICPEQVVTIVPNVIGNTETPTYLWSSGSTNPTETVTGGVDTELIVTISTPSGCTGTDTTTISITAPVDVTVTPFAGCTDGSLEITNTTGGAGNYQYSLDGTTWQSSTNFPSLSFGTYTVSVLDDLGCIYDTTAQLDGTAMSVEMSFVASTYNEEGDTIVLVNTTEFTGLDSVAWNLPPTANVTYLSDTVVILSIADGGWYDVELIGYLDATCEFSYVNPVFFGDQAPFFDDSTFFNGIDSLIVYPNAYSLGSGIPITVYVEFGKAQNYTILVTNSLGQPIPTMSVSGVGEVAEHDLLFPIGTAAGVYRFHVIADYDVRHYNITVTP